MPTETQRCTGQCCKAFVVPAVHEMGGLEAFRAYLAETERIAADPDSTPRERYARRLFQDGPQIAAMLIELGETSIDPLTFTDLEPPQMLYGCRNWDAATGDCTAHETRPAMCREWPYAGTVSNHGETCGACPMAGCTRRVEPARVERVAATVDRELSEPLADDQGNWIAREARQPAPWPR